MFHPPASLSLRLLLLAVLSLLAPLALATPTLSLGPFGPGTIDGSAPFNILGGCASTTDSQIDGEDCGESNGVVRTQDVVSHVWSITADAYTPGAPNLKNVVLEQTIKPSANAVIQFQNLPVSCTPIAGGGSKPVSGLKDNGDGSWTMTCNLGEFTEGQQKSLTVTVKISGKSQNGSSYTSSQRVYSVADDGVTENATGASYADVGPIKISAQPAYDLIHSINTTQGFYNTDVGVRAVKDLNGDGVIDSKDNEPGYYTYGLVRLAAARKTGIEALAQPISFKDQFKATALATNGADFPLEFYVTECRDNPSGWGGEVFGSESYYPSYDNYSYKYHASNSGTCSYVRDNPADPTSTAFTVTINNADLSGTHYPTLGFGGVDLSAGPYYVVDERVQFWIPFRSIDMTDGVMDNQGSVYLSSTLMGFDPAGLSGTSNYGTGVEPGYDGADMGGLRGNNRLGPTNYYLTVRGSFAKYAIKNVNDAVTGYIWPGSGNHTGDGELEPGQAYVGWVQYVNNGTLALQNPRSCDVFDNTVQVLTDRKDSGGTAGTYAYVGTYAPNGFDYKNYVVEYAHLDLTGDDPLDGNHDGTTDYDITTGRYNGDWTKARAAHCDDAAPADGWFTDPTQVPGGIDAVNAARVRLSDTAKAAGIAFDPGQEIRFAVPLKIRDTFKGGAHDGQAIPVGTVAADFGGVRADNWSSGWTARNYIPAPETSHGDGDRVTISRLKVMLDSESLKPAASPGNTASTLAGSQIVWKVSTAVQSTMAKPSDAVNLRIVDELPPTATYNAACTTAQTGGTPPSLVQYNTDRNGNPKTGYTRLLWNFGNVTANTVMPPRIFCTDTDSLAPNGTSVVNYAEIQADNILTALSSRSDTHTITLEQTGSIQVSKKVDMPLDDLNDDQVYTLSWANFAAAFTINKPTIIDVFPFMSGSGDGTSLSARTPTSNFHGKLVLTGAPTVTWMDGSTPTGSDPSPTLGTWYYSSDAPETIDYNPDANAAAGTTKWCLQSAFGTAGCPAAFDKVTAVKFVSNYDLAKDGDPRKGMIATYTMQAGDTVDPNSANANKPGDLYTNRFAFDTSSMDAAQFLRSNNVSVQVAAYSIGDFIFADNNQNGKYDAGIDAPAPDGVTVELYNSSDKKVATTTTGLVGPGRFLFQPLASGSYYIKIPASQFQTGGKLYGWKDSVIPNDAKPDDDQNETVDQNGYVSGTLLSSGIRTGLITLSANPPPPGGVPTGNEPTGDNVLPIADPTGDDFSNLTLDIGLIPPPSSLGDVVWNDVNQNGIQDVGELGLSNVLVKLLDKNGIELTNMRTDAAGKYLFSNLAAGTYFVEIVKPAGYTSSPADQGADDTADSDIIVATGRTAAITLGVGVNKLDVDAGLYKAASIGDRVWLDANADGKQDASETTNLANVTIVLKDSAGATVATTQTDANGAYQFSGLMPGTYKVDIDTASASLTGYTLTTGNDPLTVTLAEGQAYVDADFGFVNYASVGDHVWEDLNGNGLQDAGEPGIAGVTVRLLDKTGANVVRTTTTDASGNYLFSSLTPGDYLIEFAKPAAYAGFIAANQGADDSKDSDADVATGRTAVFTLAGGANPRDVDAGLYKAASLGDLVWFDADGNGQQGVAETGVAGIAVSLSGTRGDGTAITALNTTTDALGKYQFTGLYPGSYTVKFTLAAGMGFTTQNAGTDDTLDSDVAAAGTVTATLASGASNQTLDAGVQPATVSGRVWSDNKTPNSIDDGTAAESGVVGVTVNLINSATGEVVATTTTGANGNYTFTGVLPGNYLVQVLQPANMEFVLKDQGGNDAIDSDVDPANGKTAAFAVASGDAIIDVDAGIKPGSLGDRVWLDLNGNNLQDSGEPGVANVVVNLLDGSNNVVATQTTDANGFYNFDAILPGNYTVQFVPPAGMTFVGANQGTDDTLDSDPAGDGKVAVTVVSGVSNQTVDAGLAAAKLGDYVWLDKNGDGKQDAGEPPVAGMTIKLLDKNGNPVLDAGGNPVTTVTGVDGKYQFTVQPGEYRIGFDKPAGVAFSPVAQGTADKDSNADPATGMTAAVTLASGASDLTLDAGLLPAVVSGSVIKDANANGAKDSGETGLAGVSITLTGTDVFGQPVSMTTTTDTNGAYSFQVMPGTYTVKETNPVDYLSSGSVAGTATGAAVVGVDELATPAVAGTPATNNDFLDYHLGSIAGQVRHDTDYDGSFADTDGGIAGVTISLFADPNGDGDPADGVLLGTATTDASGHYLFSNVKPGNYVVVETDLDLWESTADIVGANDNRVPVALASAQNSTGNDYLDAQQKGSLSGVIWTDSNADGVRDASEPVLGGIKVVVTDSTGAVVANLTTAADGSYKADNLPPGTYTVKVDSSSLPAGVLQTGDPDGLKDQQTSATVSAGADTSGLDFGYVGGASLGDLVWDDLNGNGVQDAGEPGVGGVAVNLLDKTGTNILKTTTTNSSGLYSFTGLLPGGYIVEFRKPDAYSAFVTANVGGDGIKDSDVSDIKAVSGVVTGRTAVVTLAGGANRLDVDAGLVKPASLGDFVWFDSNGDGIQQVGEPGLAGITVTLSGTLGNGTALPPQAVQTDTNGHYLFGNLYPGDYSVSFTLPTGMAFTAQNQGTDDLGDSDVAANGSASVTLKSSDNNLSLDAGVQPASVTGRVWIDDNMANAQQDVAEKGVVGVTVNLIDTATGKVVATTTTGADGVYHFTGIMPGSYQVQVIEPANMGFVKQDQGGDDTKDSDVDPANGKSQTFTLTSGSTVSNVDAGIEPGSLGDHVWLDVNGNNLQDSGEPGVANVTVNLLDKSGTVVSTQTTDASGFYNFATVAPGDYTVQFVPPAGMSLVTANTGTDDTLDSDPAVDGKVAVTVVSGVGNQTVDAGIVPARLGDYVWMDLDGDGTQGANEPAVAGMTVHLLDKDGNPVKDAGGNDITAVTDASGKYSFTVLPGEYKVGFVLPPLATFTKLDQGSNDAADSDADPATGVSASVVVVSGDNNQTLDAGLLPAKVSGYAIEDLNADGKLDAGETALAGVTITLKGADVFGNPVTATAATDNNGLYSFTVPAGTYTLTETNPATYLSSGSQPGSATGASTVSADELSTPVTGGSSSDNNNFFDYRLGSIAGQLRDDVDYDGDLKDAETGIGGATITLYTDPNGDGDITDGVKVASTATDSTGAYLFPNLKPGNYVVVEGDLALWMSTGDAAGANDNAVPVKLASAQNSTGNDFLDAKQRGSLAGTVWNDTNADGVHDAGETGLAGVTVTVLNANGEVVATLTTDANGAYVADNLIPGSYTVKVDPATVPANTQQTADPDGVKDHQTVAVVQAAAQTTGMDFGYVGLVSVGDKVWLDTNADGIQDVGETGLSGVMVTLYQDANGNGVAEADEQVKAILTDSTGAYLFDKLLPLDYLVTFSLPEGYQRSPATQGTDGAVDSDADSKGVAAISLKSGSVTTVDAGFYKLGSIGDHVWLDANENGIQDAGEPAITGLTVQLLDKDGKEIASTTTDARGHYLFADVVPGNYSVKFVMPAGLVATKADQGTDDALDSDADASGVAAVTLASGQQITTVDAGILPAAISGRVWIDRNANAVDDTESGVPGVSVRLLDAKTGDVVATTTTGAQGEYSFSGILPGDYRIEVVQPANMVFVTPDQGSDDTVDSDVQVADGRSAVFTLKSTDAVTDMDAGIQPGGLGDHVWLDQNGNGLQDAGEPGLANITVKLFDTTGKEAATQTTDATGFYNFTGVLPGDYTVQFVLPEGAQFTDANKGTDDELDSDVDAAGKVAVTVVSNVGNQSVDAGIKPATVSGQVVDDLNADGKQDNGEPPVAGVTVKLVGTDLFGNPVTLVSVTDAAGKYSFIVPPGTYTVTETNLDGTVSTGSEAGTPGGTVVDADTLTVTVSSGQESVQNNFMDYQAASISGQVRNDLNANGNLADLDTGLADITVTLWQDGKQLASTTTDASGDYSFTGLKPGTYSVQETDSAGWVSTADVEGANDNQISVTLASGEDKTGQDFLDTGLAVVGDKVWLDKNGNAVQDADEPGVAGVTVVLSGADGAGQAVNQTATTDANGAYQFAQLKPGTYTLEFQLPQGMTLVLADQGGDDATDSDPDAASHKVAVTLLSAEQNLSVDAGVVPASISGVAWEDVNGDGIANGSEPVLAGVVVNLYSDPNGDGNPADGTLLGTVTATATGAYSFTGLLPDHYVIAVTPPESYVPTLANQGNDDSVDSDIPPSLSLPVALQSGDTSHVDAGFYRPGSFGDRIWLDVNGNGKQDAGELSVRDVVLVLMDAAGNPVVNPANPELPYRVTSDVNGEYQFTGLLPGKYQVQLEGTDGYLFTQTDAGNDDTLDSDANANGRMTAVVTSGSYNPTVDAGILPASVSGRVWVDRNTANGLDDSMSAEPGVPGITVNLLDKQGNVVASTTSGTDGLYGFSGVLPGEYRVAFVIPPSLKLVDANVGNDDTIDSDADPATGLTDAFTVTSSSVVKDLDAGILAGAIGDRVWADLNENGIQDAGEPGVAGINVKLIDSKGAELAMTTTDSSGFYAFHDVAPGDYTVQFVTGDLKLTLAKQGEDSGADSDADPATGKATVTVVSGVAGDQTIDAGVLPAKIGDFVWLDANANGIQDQGEMPLANVAVILLDENGGHVATTTTASDGHYQFAVAPAYYSVQVVSVDSSFTKVGQGSDPALDSDVNEMGVSPLKHYLSGVTVDTVDAGILPGIISGKVINDTWADGNADDGDTGLAGFTVTVTGTDSYGNPVSQTTVTGEDGSYAFQLPPGTYTVTESQPAGYVSTGSSAATTDGSAVVDKDNVKVVLQSGWKADNVDFLDYDPSTWVTASGKVIDDHNHDGQVGTTERGLENVSVTLYTDPNGDGDPSDGQPIETVQTDASGTFSFAKVPAGQYVVVETDPVNFDSTADSDGANDNRVKLVLVSGEQPAQLVFLDAEPFSSLTGYVHLDTDRNGDLTDPDSGVAGVTLQLYSDPNGDGDPSDGEVVATVQTDADGHYAFADVVTGHYVIVETDKSGYISTADVAGDNDNRIPVSITVVGDHQSQCVVGEGQESCTGLTFLDSALDSGIQLRKTAYHGHDGGAKCGTDEAKDKLTLVDLDKNLQEDATYCFEITNTGENWLADIALVDETLGLTADKLTPIGTVPTLLAPVSKDANAVIRYYYESVVTKSLVNTASVTAKPALEDGTLLGDAVDAKGTGSVDLRFVFDPPTATKTVTANGDYAMLWKMVWINSSSDSVAGVQVYDGVPEGTHYVAMQAGANVSADGVYCEARGTSTTATCQYEAPSAAYPRGRVIWKGTIGGDVGHTTEADAANEVVIRFYSMLDKVGEAQTISNQAHSSWDLDNDGKPEYDDVVSDNGGTDDPGDSTTISVGAATQIPTLNEWALFLLSGLLVLVAFGYQRYRRKW